MLVPHGSGKPVQFHLSLSLILILLGVWTGITAWGSYLSARHVDYWRSELANQVLQMKVQYLVKQLDKSRGFMDEVKQIEAKLRDLLEYKSKSSIIINEPAAQAGATGGPTTRDQDDITGLLALGGLDISWERLVEKSRLMKIELQDRMDSYNDLESWIEKQRRLYRNTPRGWPAEGHLSSHFGRRLDPFSKLMEYHYGVDISNKMGTPVRATADGKIRLSSWHSGYGKLVVIEHEFGYTTRYAHNDKLLVKVGDTVKRGQVIALMGNTGKSSGPHCHYEVWQNRRRLNPYAFLNGDFPKIRNASKVSGLNASKRQKRS